MPIYEYECIEHGKFDVLESIRKVGTTLQDYTAPCPDCSVYCESIMSTFTSTESEYFAVTDGKGNVISRKQVSKYAPAYNDLATRPKDIDPQKDNGVVWDRASGGIFYNRNRP